MFSIFGLSWHMVGTFVGCASSYDLLWRINVEKASLVDRSVDRLVDLWSSEEGRSIWVVGCKGVGVMVKMCV